MSYNILIIKLHQIWLTYNMYVDGQLIVGIRLRWGPIGPIGPIGPSAGWRVRVLIASLEW